MGHFTKPFSDEKLLPGKKLRKNTAVVPYLFPVDRKVVDCLCRFNQPMATIQISCETGIASAAVAGAIRSMKSRGLIVTDNIGYHSLTKNSPLRKQWNQKHAKKGSK